MLLVLTESYKCTGQPGPCKACVENDRHCHFDTKLDARRKTAYERSATDLQQQFILKGLLLSIKFNNYDMVQGLVDVIRNDKSLSDVAKSLQRNIEALYGEDELTKQAINETDLIAVVLRCLPCSRPRSRKSSKSSAPPDDLLSHFSSSSSEMFSASPTSNADLSWDDISLSQVQSSQTDTGQSSMEFEPPLDDTISMFTSNMFEVRETLV